MNFDVKDRTILLVRHGSQCYGTNVAGSDLDLKGVCIEPIEYHFGYLNRFEQLEQMANKGHDADFVIYSLKKFARLAADCNPNIVEVLWVDEACVEEMDEFGEELRANAELFLSKKARYTFSGYMMSQVKRIKTHRVWLLNPPKEPSSRTKMGLPEQHKVLKGQLGVFGACSAVELIEQGVPRNIVALFLKEREYQSKMTQWKQYQHWKKSRNPARAELEAKYGYDTKHANHVVRLGRMCVEILSGQGVIVKRPDAMTKGNT